jgi:1,4-alpha-glucan branching enzyme
VRILVLTADYAPGAWSGIGTAVAAQAAAVARRGVDVDVMVADARLARAAAREGRLRVHALGRTRFGLNPAHFDAVHLHSLGLTELALELSRRFGLPLVYSAHASVREELAGRARAGGWARAQDALLAHAEHVIFPGAGERDAAIRRRPDLRSRSRVLANGVPVLPARPALAARLGPIVFAGRFAETKGLTLLRDIVTATAAHPELRYVLAGGHGDAHGHRVVGELVSRFANRCRTVGWLEPRPLERLLATASMVLVPSRYEPFGMVALEAMRVGTPVVAAATGGLREVVGPGSGGVLVESRRAEDWRTAILELWRSAELRTTLARRGPIYVAARFDADTLACALVDGVYRPLLAEGVR